MFGLTWLRAKQSGGLRALAVLVLVAGGIGLFLPKLLMDSDHAGVISRPSPQSSPAPGQPTPAPTATPMPDLQTFEYRLHRLRLGMPGNRQTSLDRPGCVLLRERHFEATGTPDVISSWPVLVLHDAGLIGLAAFLALLGLLGLRLWRTSGDSARGPTASAYAAAIVVLLVAYLATTAVHFAVTWLIFGGAARCDHRLAARRRGRREGHSGTGVAHDRAAHREVAAAPPSRRSCGSWRQGRATASSTWASPTRAGARAIPRGAIPVARADHRGRAGRVPAFTAAFPDVRFRGVQADGRSVLFGDAEFDIGFQMRSSSTSAHATSSAASSPRSSEPAAACSCARPIAASRSIRTPCCRSSIGYRGAGGTPSCAGPATGTGRAESMLNPLSARRPRGPVSSGHEGADRAPADARPDERPKDRDCRAGACAANLGSGHSAVTCAIASAARPCELRQVSRGAAAQRVAQPSVVERGTQAVCDRIDIAGSTRTHASPAASRAPVVELATTVAPMPAPPPPAGRSLRTVTRMRRLPRGRTAPATPRR